MTKNEKMTEWNSRALVLAKENMVALKKEMKRLSSIVKHYEDGIKNESEKIDYSDSNTVAKICYTLKELNDCFPWVK